MKAVCSGGSGGLEILHDVSASPPISVDIMTGGEDIPTLPLVFSGCGGFVVVAKWEREGGWIILGGTLKGQSSVLVWLKETLYHLHSAAIIML